MDVGHMNSHAAFNRSAHKTSGTCTIHTTGRQGIALLYNAYGSQSLIASRYGVLQYACPVSMHWMATVCHAQEKHASLQQSAPVSKTPAHTYSQPAVR